MKITKIKNILINKNDNIIFINDYKIADKLIRIFSILWIFYTINEYQILSQRPVILYEPIIWFQKLLMNTFPSKTYFYFMAFLGIILSIYTIFKQNWITRFLLFLVLCWLNAVKWNYNFFSHVEHLFLLTHFLSIFLYFKNETIKEKASAIRWFLCGIMFTYTFAGIWKFLGLAYKLILQPNKTNWLNEDAVELNAIVSSFLYDEKISFFMLKIYGIPIIWQILTLGVFFIQFFAVFAGLNKKISYFIAIGLILFHLYNLFFINTFFYVAPSIILILFFPYHIFYNKQLLLNL